MENLSSIALILALSCFLASTTLNVHARKQFSTVAEEETDFLRSGGGNERVMKLTLYVQDLRIGNKNATVVEVAKAAITDTSPFSFGSVHVLDDLVTAGPALNSLAVGRVQGLTTNADLSTFGIAMNLNFYFTEGSGKLSGSTLSILGRNGVLDAERELPVAGGTGIFRNTRGYAIQTSYSMDAAASYAVLKYTIYTTYNTKLTDPTDFDVAIM